MCQRYLYYRTEDIYPHYSTHPVSSEELRKMFSVNTLSSSRDINDCLFLYKLINNKIDCPQLLDKVLFKVKARHVRSQKMFNVKGDGTPLDRLMKIFNCLPDEMDPFVTKYKSFIKKLQACRKSALDNYHVL